MTSEPLEIVERQSEIIRSQTETIVELYRLLQQHISVEEADRLRIVCRIEQTKSAINEIDV